jgi:hypothetical protein
MKPRFPFLLACVMLFSLLTPGTPIRAGKRTCETCSDGSPPICNNVEGYCSGICLAKADGCCTGCYDPNTKKNSCKNCWRT